MCSTLLNTIRACSRQTAPRRVVRVDRLCPPPKLCFQPRHFHSGTRVQAGAMNSREVFTIQVQGPYKSNEANHKQQLLSQIENIPKDAQSLRIEEDTPSDIEWSLLGDHFTEVKDLVTDSGWNEMLNDEKTPLHWPLEHLRVGSSCGEVFRSPFVVEGKTKHLVLFLTSGLRFEGPTSDELCRADSEAIKRGEKKARFMTVKKGTPEERQIELTYLPEIVQEWMAAKYSNQSNVSYPEDQLPEQINLATLEILENDAIDSFNRMTLARPHLVTNLKTLNIRSTSGLDFHFTTEDMFAGFLPQLVNMKTLVLTAGDIFKDQAFLPNFIGNFPPNLTTLRFRGPISLCRSEEWLKWVESFASKDFLPGLERLSFVLDLHYPLQEDSKLGRKTETKPDEETLREGKAACNQIYAGAKDRGITIEPFHDKWTNECPKLLRQVDDRWEGL